MSGKQPSGIGMKVSIALLILVGLPCLPAMGQMSIETPPNQRTLPTAEQVEREMVTARFRLGPLRLLPFFTLDNVGWTNNAGVTSEGQLDDFTASASAGARFVIPFGRKIFLRGNVAPAYDWYYRTEYLRSFGGDYSGEVIGLFNRVTIGAGGGYTERIGAVSSEVARDVLNRTMSAAAKVDVKLFERLSLFGGVQGAKLTQEDPNANTPGLGPISDLNRAETGYRGGLRYAFSSVLSFGMMGEQVATRFDDNGELRDYDVRGLSLVVRYDRERFYVEGTVGTREGTAVTPNQYFPEFQTGTYGYFVSYRLTNSLEMQILGSRRPVASLFLDNPYYLETRNGASLRLTVGRRLKLNVSGELGSNRYVNPVLEVSTGEIVARIDDTSTFGGGFDFSLSPAVTVGITVTQDRYSSNIDYYDRNVFRISGGLRISADFGRDEKR